MLANSRFLGSKALSGIRCHKCLTKLQMYGAVTNYDKPLLIRLFRNAVVLAVAKSLLWPMSLYVQWETGFDCAIQVRVVRARGNLPRFWTWASKFDVLPRAGRKQPCGPLHGQR